MSCHVCHPQIFRSGVQALYYRIPLTVDDTVNGCSLRGCLSDVCKRTGLMCLHGGQITLRGTFEECVSVIDLFQSIGGFARHPAILATACEFKIQFREKFNVIPFSRLS